MNRIRVLLIRVKNILYNEHLYSKGGFIMFSLLIWVIILLAIGPWLVRSFSGLLGWGAKRVDKTVEEFRKMVRK